MTLRTNKTMMMIALTILTTAIFFIDTFVPLGITGSVMYVFVVLVSLWLPYPYATVITAMVCTVLTFSSLAFLPDGSEWGTVVLNRSLAVFAIWATAILGSRVKQHIRTLEIREGRLHVDIMERKQAEQPQELQQAILQKIVNGNHSQDDILNDLCLHVEHMFPSAFCAILLLDESTGTLKVGAAPSRRETACTILDGLVPGEYAGACGTAVHTRTTVIIEDTETDPRWEPIREAARPLGIKSCWSIPIICEKNRVLGTFAIAHSQVQRPTPQDLQLLETASYLAGITVQRHQTDQNQRKSEERYRTLYENNPSMYFTISLEGTILSVNQFGAQQHGYTVHELLGKSVSMLLVEEDRGALAEKLVECLKNPQDLQHWEFRKIRKDGQRIWVRETVRVVKDPHHQTVFLIVCDDITLQKQVDTRAFENEQAIRELYEITSSPNRSFEHRVRSLLALGCRRFKLPVGLLTHRIADELELKFVCSSDPAIKEGTRVPLSNPFCSKVMVADTPIGVEHASKSEWRHHPEYPEFKAWPFEAFLGTKVLAGAEPYGTFCFAGPDPYIGTFSDADKDFLQLIARWVGTELEGMKAEAALRKSHTLMNAVLEGTTDAFFVKDLEGRYLMMNAAGKQWVNMTDQDLTGKTDEDIFAPKTVACIKQQDEIILQTGTTQTFEEEVMTNGVKRTFLTTKGPYRDIDGHIIGLFGNVRDITQRKQSEEKLQEIHMALSNAMPGIAQVNPDGCCTEVNDIYASMLGFSGSELVESSWKPTVHPDDISLATTAYQNMMTDGKGEFEARAIRKDGSTFYQHVLLVKRVDAHGDFLGHHCFMRDVTERRQAEEMLRTIIEATSSVVSTDFFHSLLTHLAEALQVKFAFITGCTDSTNTRVRTFAFLQGNDFVENVTYDLAGTPCEQVIQGAIGYYPENVQALFPLDQDLVALKAESYIGLPLQDASGATIGHIAVMNDRPMPRDTQAESLLKVFAGRAGVELERYRAETALRRSEGRLRQIIDMVPHYIFAKDKNGAFILANQAVADVYGTTLENLIGKTEDDFHLSSEEVLRFRNDDNEVLETGQIKIIQEEQITDSTGKVHFLQTTKIPFVFADTSLPSILGISIDISEQRQAKEQLEDAYERLRDMTTRVKAAEESERKRIARELHDEFGQMLTGLKFDMAWLHRRLSEPSPQTSMPPILDKLDSMTRLTDTLIHTVRRIATSLRPSILDDLGLLPALEWQVQDFQNRTGIKCTFSTELDGTTLCLENDHATALFRIAQELFTNILRHAEASCVKLALQKDAGFLTLSVRDNGRGITKHRLTRPLLLACWASENG